MEENNEPKDFNGLPVYEVERKRLEEGIEAYILFAEAFNMSRSAARRLIEQGGAYMLKRVLNGK